MSSAPFDLKRCRVLTTSVISRGPPEGTAPTIGKRFIQIARDHLDDVPLSLLDLDTNALYSHRGGAVLTSVKTRGNDGLHLRQRCGPLHYGHAGYSNYE